jgi:hypothetical protein
MLTGSCRGVHGNTQAIPLLWLLLLWRVRGKLNPSSVVADVEAVLAKRKTLPELNHLSFLWSDYLPHRWYFEVIEM